MTEYADILRLFHPAAEETTLAAMRDDSNVAIQLVEFLTPDEYYEPRYRLVFEAFTRLLRGIEPVDTEALVDECNALAREQRLSIQIAPDFIDDLTGETGRAVPYANTLKRLSWLRKMSDFTFWMVQELQSKPDPDELFTAAQERWQHLQPIRKVENFVYGWDTIKLQQQNIRKRVVDQRNGVVTPFNWPWEAWNKFVRPLRAGTLGIFAAPDGMGKSTYLEMVAEHWAKGGAQTVYVHLEDDLSYKLDRRDARQAKVEMNKIEDGLLDRNELNRIDEAHKAMADWVGNLHYYHAPGLGMVEIIRELEARVKEGVCQAVVFDYLDKVQPTRGQAKLFGDNTWERQANDMEALKSFAEQNHLPIFAATQGNADMQGPGTQTRKNIQGSKQKSHKSQLVVILTRDIVGENGLEDKDGNLLAEPGEYSPIAKLRIDKQNRGRTGSFEQFYIGKFFLVKDLKIQREAL